MNVLVLLGHPDKETKCGSLADSYERGARDAGNTVRRINLEDLKFDPILHKGYKVIQPLEPDLIMAQDAIKWAQHIAIFYPSWWSTMPALLKGFFDRIWIPGFAFKFKKDGYMAGKMWKRLLSGRTATVFVTSDSHPILARFVFGDTTNEIRKCVLWFAGFKVKVKKIGPLKDISEKNLNRWQKKVEVWGKKLF
jgi:NAD(P)H dehydrogenase (quinone)